MRCSEDAKSLMCLLRISSQSTDDFTSAAACCQVSEAVGLHIGLAWGGSYGTPGRMLTAVFHDLTIAHGHVVEHNQLRGWGTLWTSAQCVR